MVPQEVDIKNHCELDEGELWPAYQCVDCGIIVGSKKGSYIKLPPSTVVRHKHTRNRPVRDQFIDVVYKYHIDVNIYQNRDKYLSHCYSSRKVVGLHVIDDLIERKISPETYDLCVPIHTSGEKDFSSAISEVFANYQNPSMKIEIKQLITEIDSFNRINDFIIDNEFLHPAFAGLLRLTCNLSGNHRLSQLPVTELLLSMVLRLKPRDTDLFNELLTKCSITENDLRRIAIASYRICPKLLEWSIAWAEIFFTHTLS